MNASQALSEAQSAYRRAEVNCHPNPDLIADEVYQSCLNDEDYILQFKPRLGSQPWRDEPNASFYSASEAQAEADRINSDALLSIKARLARRVLGIVVDNLIRKSKLR